MSGQLFTNTLNADQQPENEPAAKTFDESFESLPEKIIKDIIGIVPLTEMRLLTDMAQVTGPWGDYVRSLGYVSMRYDGVKCRICRSFFDQSGTFRIREISDDERRQVLIDDFVINQDNRLADVLPFIPRMYGTLNLCSKRGAISNDIIRELHKNTRITSLRIDHSKGECAFDSSQLSEEERETCASTTI
uniref:F-box domain-containing protein n=1 Tax=Steinernema glaseri TaxID=37863 RepID=A0A1I7YTA9_9BILA